VKSSSKAVVQVLVIERQAGKSESPVQIVLCPGLLKSARFEWILEKGTELGVSTFAPILCRRSMAGLEDAGNAKVQRWQRILEEATEQCGRARRPELLPIRPLTQALTTIPARATALMLWEEERGQSLHNVLQTVSMQQNQHQQQTHEASPHATTVVLFIGPEGGLLKEEVQLAQQYGVQSVTLGTRILRAETAALVAVANVMYELEARLKKTV
jgi:16S rRNA (uracil1498-N3)-methyltransferase